MQIKMLFYWFGVKLMFYLCLRRANIATKILSSLFSWLYSGWYVFLFKIKVNTYSDHKPISDTGFC